MAKFNWTDGGNDGDWNDTSNWNDAAKPASDGEAIIDYSSRDIVTNMDQSGTVDDVELSVGPNFSGTLGTSANPLKFGGSGGADAVTINSRRSKSINLFYTDCNALYIIDTFPAGGSVYLAGGSYDFIAVNAGIGLKIGANCTLAANCVLALYGPNCFVEIENGCTFTATVTFNVFGGRLLCKAAAANAAVNIRNNGVFQLQGTDITGGTINLWSRNARAVLDVYQPGGGAITKINAYNGVVDGVADGREYTVTNIDIWPGAVVHMLSRGIVFSNTPVKYGGVFEAYTNPTIKYGALPIGPT